VKLTKPKLDEHKFLDISSLIAYQYKNFALGRSVASTLMHHLEDPRPNIELNLSLINGMLESGIAVYEFAKQFLIQNQFDLIYVFNGRFIGPAAVQAAGKELGIPILYHERGSSKDKYYLEKFVPHDRERIGQKIKEVWKQAIHENMELAIAEANSFFINNRSGKEYSWVSFIKNQQKNSLPVFNSERRIVSYFSSSDDEYEALRDLYRWEYWENQIDAVKHLINACQQMQNIDLYIRIHPNMSNKSAQELKRWTDLSGVSVFVISPESEIDTYALIEASDVVTTAGSTVGIEAVYWGKPAIVLGPSTYDDLEAVYKPKNDQELINLLSIKNLAVRPESALPYGYYFKTFGHSFNFYEPFDLFNGRFMGEELH
jgi:hypothetical protein